MSFSTLPPGASVDIKSYEISTPQEKLDELKTLIKLGRIAPPTYESLSADTKNNKFGISHEWIVDAKQEWMKFDWYEQIVQGDSSAAHIYHTGRRPKII